MQPGTAKSKSPCHAVTVKSKIVSLERQGAIVLPLLFACNSIKPRSRRPWEKHGDCSKHQCAAVLHAVAQFRSCLPQSV